MRPLNHFKYVHKRAFLNAPATLLSIDHIYWRFKLEIQFLKIAYLMDPFTPPRRILDGQNHSRCNENVTFGKRDYNDFNFMYLNGLDRSEAETTTEL